MMDNTSLENGDVFEKHLAFCYPSSSLSNKELFVLGELLFLFAFIGVTGSLFLDAGFKGLFLISLSFKLG